MTRILLFVFVFAISIPSKAEGSIDLNRLEGSKYYRLYLEWFPGSPMQVTASDGVPSTNIIYAYVAIGERLLLASSNLNFITDGALNGSGSIRYTKPDGTTIVTLIGPGTNGSTGFIGNRLQEKQGPYGLLNGGVGGYTPFDITADQTGIWSIEFLSQTPTNPNGTGGGPRLSSSNWVPNQRRTIAAWDVSVSNGTSLIPGRVYAKWLPLNPGGLTISGNPITSSYELFIRTRDGILYKWGQTDNAGYGHSIFSNNSGIMDLGLNRLFQSLRYQGIPLPADKRLYSPSYPDINEFFANKMFFNSPDAAMPAAAKLGSENNHWLNPIYSPTAPTFFYTATGTPNPMAGNFTVSYPTVQKCEIIVDCNTDNIYGNANDRTMSFYSTVPAVTVINWDGLDGNGVVLPNGCYIAKLLLQNGEVHFPMLDIEYNYGGIRLERLNGPGTVPDYTIYWNDLPLSDNTETPLGSYLKQTPAGGVSSLVNSHKWAPNTWNGNTQTHVGSYGDARFMDTWSYATTEAISVIYTVCGVLPVQLTNVTASYFNEQANIEWQTMNDHENIQYVIERSTNAIDFKEIGKVNGQKNTLHQSVYSFKDKSIVDPSVYYYRIKILAADGNFKYSKVVNIRAYSGAAENLNVYPNPSNSISAIEINSKAERETTLTITSAQGKILSTKIIRLKKGFNSLKLEESLNLQAGVYFISISGSDNKILRKTFVKL